MACSRCGFDTQGAKFCPAPSCGQLQPQAEREKVSKPSFAQKEEKKTKAAYFEEQIKAAAPKDAMTKKKTWATTSTGGDMYGTGKYKGKTTLSGPPPPAPKKLSDLP